MGRKEREGGVGPQWFRKASSCLSARRGKAVAARLRSLGSDARFLLLPEVGDDDDKRAPVVSGRERGRREGAGALA
jgi:hypothetical protein